MKQLAIDSLFIEIFQQDRDYDYSECSYYFDLERGHIIVIPFEIEEDETVWNGISSISAAVMTQEIESNDDRYIKFHGLSHYEHHDILRNFLQSDWTDDKELLQKAREAYFGSVGGWKEKIGYDDYILNHWYVFQEEEILRRALEFLHDHQIEPIDRL